MSLDSRQVIAVPLFRFGIGGGADVARDRIGGVMGGSGLGGEAIARNFAAASVIASTES
jgi:hypothetical protein